MKVLFLNCLLCLLFCRSAAQVFPGVGGPVANNAGVATEFTCNVSGLAAPLDSLYGLEEVCIDLIHPAVEELHVYLRSPTGIQVELTGMKSCKGANFSSTCFHHAMPVSVTIGNAPYSGKFRPVGNIGRFNRTQPGNGTWRLLIHDFASGVNTGTLSTWSISFSAVPGKPVILTSSNLPLVFINMPGGQPVSETSTLMDFGITDNGAARNFLTGQMNDYHGKATCNIRGASSRMFEKNNLKIELRDSAGVADREASLLGMPADSDWILTACYTDKSLIRNPLSHYLFSGMGHYSPRWRYVELIVNNEYQGVYILMEQIKRGSARVGIGKMNATDHLFPEITGGYILQIDRADDPGWYSLLPGVSSNGAKFYYQYNYPHADVITAPQKNYIKSVMDSFEVAMASSAYMDELTGYPHFIHVGSFVDFLILSELSKNADAYKLSSFLFKDHISAGGKLHAGPVWDFDLAWHNCNFGNTFSHELWQHEHNNSSNPIPTWWRRLMEDPSFREKLNCRYHALRQTLLSDNSLYNFIDEQVQWLSESRERNFRQFPIIGAYIYANPQIQVSASYENEVTHLKTWIRKRGEWLDANVPGTCTVTGADEINTDRIPVQVFPNPFTDIVHVSADKKTEEIHFQLYNMMGQRLPIHVGNPAPGKFSIATEQLQEGMYVLTATISGQAVFRKMLRKDPH